ncbi:hypothetical protein ETB97_007883 [Aspergillus alliaceus]|uniref:Fatty acyl-CoA reductase n=1 Tax=Petromyces alliaceus TaxID=209559 RepID=A0A8H6E2E5_PETAA|nr:hypothetical protein ETB97_007883 [Aspergillus burnettii]
MWEYYSGKVIFITGASGFLGTVLVYRICSQAPVDHIYLLSRGGLPRLEAKWHEHLPSKYIECLYDAKLVTVIKGDVVEPNLGIDENCLETLREQVNIIIHAASSIHLSGSLEQLSKPIIHGSERIVNYSLQCHQLDRFVYVSTAYANAFLYQESADIDPYVEEKIYPLAQGEKRDVHAEWGEVQKQGESKEYNAHSFPWPYGYAKHLTERLVLDKFTATGKAEKLLILRPSIIAPAQSFPYRGFSVPKSTPTTVLAAGLIITPTLVTRMASRAKDPERQATIDEVPVDVVVDRLLAHLAKGTTGPVHAVSGARARYQFRAFWKEAMELRRLPWPLWKRWLNVDWRSSSLHPIARIYVLYAASYHFSEEKTLSLWKSLGEEEKSGLQWFTASSEGQVGLAARVEQIRFVARHFASKSLLGRILFRLFYSS